MPGRASETYFSPTDSAAFSGSTTACSLSPDPVKTFLYSPYMNTATWREFPLRTKRLRSTVRLESRRVPLSWRLGNYGLSARTIPLHQSGRLRLSVHRARRRTTPACARDYLETCPGAGTWR